MSVKLRSKPLKSGGEALYLDIYHNGKRNYEFLKIHILPKDSKEDKKEKKTLADSIRAKRQLEINNDEYGFVPSFKRKADFIEYFQKFNETYKGKGIRKFVATLHKFDDYLKHTKNKTIPSKNIDRKKWESLPIKNLTKKNCKGFYDYLKDECGLSGETPFDYFKRFQRVINKAIDEDIILKNPAKGIKVTRESNLLKKEVLTKEELQLLAKTYCGNDEVKRAFLFACFTGLGEAEIRQLNWGKIKNNRIKTEREKNGKPVYNQLPVNVIQLLGNPAKPDEKIFTLPSSTAISKNIRNWIKKAEIGKHITFYCARHTFGVLLVKSGANLKVVANCMAHSTTQTTEKYLNHLKAEEDEAINSLPTIDF